MWDGPDDEDDLDDQFDSDEEEDEIWDDEESDEDETDEDESDDEEDSDDAQECAEFGGGYWRHDAVGCTIWQEAVPYRAVPVSKKDREKEDPKDEQ